MKNLKFFILSIIGLLIILPALVPLFSPQFFHLHDYTHVARLAQMDTALAEGHFPVRWSKDFGFGYGMPLFNFYGPTPYYIATLFHTFFFSYLDSFKLLIALSFYLSFIIMYYFSRRYWGRLGGLVSATAFVYIPYRAVDIYIRGAINEIFGITFAALALLAIDRFIVRPHRKWFIIGAAAIAGLITSHNLTAIITLPALALFGLVLTVGAYRHRAASTLSQLLGMGLVGLMLSAFYALPAFLEKGFTNISQITSGYFHYSQHFLYLRQFLHSPWGFGGSIYGLEDGISFEIGKIHLLLTGFTLGVILFSQAKIKFETKLASLVGVCITGAAILMATFKTQFIWDAVTLLQFIQFPWRYLSLIIIFIAFLSGGFVLALSHKPYLKFSAGLMAVILLISLNHSLFRPEKYLDNAQSLYYAEPARIQNHMSSVLPDYIPPGVTNPQTPPIARFMLKSGNETKPLYPTINRTHEFLVTVDYDQPSTFIANIFAFPGWQFFLNEKPIEPTITADVPVYAIELTPPSPGKHTVYISGILTNTSVRLWANFISLAGLAIITYLWIRGIPYGQNNK